MTLRTQPVRTLEQVRAFLDGSEAVDFAGVDEQLGQMSGAATRKVLRRGLSGCSGVPAPSRGVVDESCGPLDHELHRTHNQLHCMKRKRWPRTLNQHRQCPKIEALSIPIPAAPTVPLPYRFRLISVLD